VLIPSILVAYFYYLQDCSGFEEIKIYRQHIGTATLPVDETGYILHYQYSINKEFSFHTGYRTI